MQLDDEAAGGGVQNNVALELQRQEAAQQELQKRRALAAGVAGKGEGGDAKPAANQTTQEDAPGDVRVIMQMHACLQSLPWFCRSCSGRLPEQRRW